MRAHSFSSSFIICMRVCVFVYNTLNTPASQDSVDPFIFSVYTSVTDQSIK